MGGGLVAWDQLALLTPLPLVLLANLAERQSGRQIDPVEGDLHKQIRPIPGGERGGAPPRVKRGTITPGWAGFD
ncbi:MAG: hypothetical protein J2P45_12980, partial [Candidatus Dormibacteraeota bacterium]|nr:hypothetical protein [Candidatus Dormibacteraeota bacterium]